MRGVDLAAKMRNTGRALGVEVKLEGTNFWLFCPELDKTFTQPFRSKSTETAALRSLHERVYHERGKRAYEIQGGLCCFCGRPMPSNAYEIDHKASRGANGRNDRIENLQVCCTGFNGCDGHRRKHGG